ncbi:MAG: hypothetical protein EA401_06435 [Planctomycetota bacterium]|nr:MAG: hypothetical protein EA401_06435 [Planctomycetota bacterium]
MRIVVIIAALGAILLSPVAQGSLMGSCCQFTTVTLPDPQSCDSCLIPLVHVDTCCQNDAKITASQCSPVHSCGCDAQAPALAVMHSGPSFAMASLGQHPESVVAVPPEAPIAQIGWDSWRDARPPPSLQILYCRYLI